MPIKLCNSLFKFSRESASPADGAALDFFSTFDSRFLASATSADALGATSPAFCAASALNGFSLCFYFDASCISLLYCSI